MTLIGKHKQGECLISYIILFIGSHQAELCIVTRKEYAGIQKVGFMLNLNQPFVEHDKVKVLRLWDSINLIWIRKRIKQYNQNK